MLPIDTPILTEKTALARKPELYLNKIWEKYFYDVARINEVRIAYCYPWKRRLGLIRLSLDSMVTFIGLNALLQMDEVPEYILITTIAHEMAHYAHGFGSPLTRQFDHPHANNVVPRELERRGLGKIMRLCDEWIDKNWFSFYDRERETGWAGIPAACRSARGQKKIQT
jgi:hypothetical protein